jgi:hypothetical protein
MRGVRTLALSMLLVLLVMVSVPTVLAQGDEAGDAGTNRLFDFGLAPDDGARGGNHDGSLLAEHGWLIAEASFLLLLAFILWALSRPPREVMVREEPVKDVPTKVPKVQERLPDAS